MLGRNFKFFLPIISGFLMFIAGLSVMANSSVVQAGYTDGSITVCKVIVDSNGNIVDGSTKPGVTFSLSGINPAQNTGPAPIGQIGNSQFTTPLLFNTNLFGTNDAKCVTYSNLALGNYYYGQETISPASGWETPKYNDQFTVPVATLSDFFDYDANFYDGDASNDASRNTNADGHIVLDQERPNRTLIVLNKLKAVVSPPSTGGSSGDGGGVFTCPVNGLPQKVDQVWFSDVTATSVIVHWANLGDANGYQIAYGLEPNNWLWGVKIGNVNQYTLNNLPTSSIWVSIIPLGDNDCPGDPSDPVQPGAVGGQVLGASTLANTGLTSTGLLFALGLGSIGLGLWQAQTALQKRSKKA